MPKSIDELKPGERVLMQRADRPMPTDLGVYPMLDLAKIYEAIDDKVTIKMFALPPAPKVPPPLIAPMPRIFRESNSDRMADLTTMARYSMIGYSESISISEEEIREDRRKPLRLFPALIQLIDLSLDDRSPAELALDRMIQIIVWALIAHRRSAWYPVATIAVARITAIAAATTFHASRVPAAATDPIAPIEVD